MRCGNLCRDGERHSRGSRVRARQPGAAATGQDRAGTAETGQDTAGTAETGQLRHSGGGGGGELGQDRVRAV